jgi:hypothetical protein
VLPKKKPPITLAEHFAKIAKRGGKARMAQLTDDERKALAEKGGRSGGQARGQALSPEQRSAIARKAALAMWRRRRTDRNDAVDD